MTGAELDVIIARLDAWIAARDAYDSDLAMHCARRPEGHLAIGVRCQLEELSVLETGARAAYFAVAT